jgi:serine/threonine-protein kinase
MAGQAAPERRAVRFGVFELDVASGELRKHGVRLRLQDQPLKLLCCLLESPGEIRSREELIHELWPEGTFVDFDRGLNTAVTRLRQVIGDSAESPRYVETVGRKGYRFIAPVEQIPKVETESATPVGPMPNASYECAGPVAGQPPAVGRRTVARLSAYALILVAGITIGAALSQWRFPRSALQPLFRFSVVMPEGATVAGEGTQLALSADGSSMVVSVRGADSKFQLLTLRLDQSQFAPLRGGEGGGSPFFSPDGQWVAFFADGKLKRAPVRGGTPVTLADASTFQGPMARFPSGSWGDNGNIVAMLNPAVGLVRLSSAGGTPSPIAGLTKAETEVDTWPQVLPGSDAVLFTRHSGFLDYASIEAFSFKSGRKTIWSGGYFGHYLTDGRLVFVRGNTLFAAPFDLKNLTITGSPRPVLEDLPTRRGGTHAGFSQTGVVAYVAEPDEPPLALFSVHQSGTTVPIQPPPGRFRFYASPRFSPNGKQLAVSVGNGGQHDIWVEDIERGTWSRLTALPALNDSPVWSADGTRLFFRSFGHAKPGIYTAAADGSSEPERLLDLRNGEAPSSMSPDGRQLVFWNRGTIWTAPVERDGRKLSVKQPEEFLKAPFNPAVLPRSAPVFSPDGHWLAYCSNESGRLEVYVTPFPKSTEKSRISRWGGRFPIWSRSGSEIFFLESNSSKIMVVPYQIEGHSFNAGEPRPWSNKPLMDLRDAYSYDVHPDGKRFIAVLDGAGTADPKPVYSVTFLMNFFDELSRRMPSKRN